MPANKVEVTTPKGFEVDVIDEDVVVSTSGTPTIQVTTAVQSVVSVVAAGVVGPPGKDGIDGSGAADADASTKGILKLAGDLAGTASSPQIATGVIVNADINAAASIALSKLATDPLARANHTGSQTASTISDFDTQVRLSRLDQMAVPTADIDLNTHKLIGVVNPTSAQHAATKKYVDDAIPSVPVTTVFSRTGTVVAATNDYTWAQIDKTTSSLADITTKPHSALTGIGTNTHTQIDTHIADTANPHVVTKTQVSLGNVDNTSDATKFAATAVLTNKRVTKRVSAVTQSATPTMNTDNMDVANITALAQAITSMTTNLTGAPSDADTLIVRITDNGTARAITWGASFEASTVALPTTTVISTMLTVGFMYNGVTSKWRCLAVA